jgi:tRNA threonylcarbamoyladenosine biosynthesis protein TsaB
MNLLAIDTSTEHLSVAVQRGEQVWEHAGAGGAQASASLVPAIQGLMQQAGLAFAQLDAIAFGAGPGSFTGLRTACSVAQGLGFGAGVPLLPVPTLLAVAEDVRQRLGARRVVAALDARMDELYAARYDFDSKQLPFDADYQLVSPENLLVEASFVLAGTAHAAYSSRITWSGPSYAALPSATAMLRLAPGMIAAGLALPAEQAMPLYIRDKVAKTTLEREAEKRLAASASAT